MAQLLIEKGYDVFGMVRGQANPKIRMIQEETPKLELVEGDLQDLSSLIAAVEQVQRRRPVEIMSQDWSTMSCH